MTFLRAVRSAELRALVIELDRVEREREGILAKRKVVALELLAEGMSEREVGAIAGVSGVAIHHWKAGL